MLDLADRQLAFADSVGNARQAYASDPPARVLLVNGSDSLSMHLAGMGASIAAAVSLEDAAAQLDLMIAADLVWLVAGCDVDDMMVARLVDAIGRCGCFLVCEAELGALDRLMAATPESIGATFLVDADAVDRRVALTIAGRPRVGWVRDISGDTGTERLDRLQEEVARIARMIDALTNARPIAPTFAADPAESTIGLRSPVREFSGPRSFVPQDEAAQSRLRARHVRRIIRQRRVREQFFPADLFADPAWDMLLDLYAARLEGQAVSVSSLCIAAAVPATTALRWIKTMTDAGLFIREADPRDGRRIFIALATATSDAMTQYFETLDE